MNENNSEASKSSEKDKISGSTLSVESDSYKVKGSSNQSEYISEESYKFDEIDFQLMTNNLNY